MQENTLSRPQSLSLSLFPFLSRVQNNASWKAISLSQRGVSWLVRWWFFIPRLPGAIFLAKLKFHRTNLKIGFVSQPRTVRTYIDSKPSIYPPMPSFTQIVLQGLCCSLAHSVPPPYVVFLDCVLCLAPAACKQVKKSIYLFRWIIIHTNPSQ